MTIEPDDLTLRQELEQLEADLAALNDRRRDLYTRSLEAAQGDKACSDVIATTMLTGPLAEGNRIAWPVELVGIAWIDDGHPCYAPAHTWVRVRPLGEGIDYLGIHVADVATGIQANLGGDGLLHLSHVAHAPVIYVPALGRIVSGLQAQWSPLEGTEDLAALPELETGAWAAQANLELAAQEQDDAPN